MNKNVKLYQTTLASSINGIYKESENMFDTHFYGSSNDDNINNFNSFENNPTCFALPRQVTP